MKRNLFQALLFSFAIFFAGAAEAQSPAKPPKWMSGKGYWVIENNIKTPKECVVYFYNNSNELLHQKIVSGKRLNPARKGVCKRLEAVLVETVTAWEKKQKRDSGQPVLTKR